MYNMKSLLFTDASMNPQYRCGIGAYLVVPETILSIPPYSLEQNDIVNKIFFKTFQNTTSTKLEIQTFLWAISENVEKNTAPCLTIFTDSQCLTELPKRRKRLESTHFMSSRTHRVLNHASMYKSIFRLCDNYNLLICKVKGHSPSHQHDTTHRIFSYVDKEVRKRMKCLFLNK